MENKFINAVDSSFMSEKADYEAQLEMWVNNPPNFENRVEMIKVVLKKIATVNVAFNNWVLYTSSLRKTKIEEVISPIPPIEGENKKISEK